jgi:hypothetical protein
MKYSEKHPEKYSDLLVQLECLEAQISAIESQGSILRQAWIDPLHPAKRDSQSKSKPDQKYQLKWTVHGETHSRTLHPHEIAPTQLAIQRGRAIEALEQKLTTLIDLLHQIEAQAGKTS